MSIPDLAPAPAHPSHLVSGMSPWRVPGPAVASGERSGVAKPGFAARPLLVTVLLAFVGALLLQWWRPCFFLTADTISASLPPTIEAYRRLWEGRSPFYDPYLFGGFDLRDDLGIFSLLCPWALLFSFLAKTSYYFLLPDIVGTGSLVTAAAAFCWSALRLRRQFALPIRPALVVALSLSYAFTPFNFLVGASWIGFLSAPAAFPLILAGACEPDWRKALAIQATGVAYALCGGHMHPFMMMGLFSTLFVVLWCVAQRRWQPLAVWVAAGALPLLLSLSLLWPAMTSFQHTDRASLGVDVHAATLFNVPAAQLAASFCLGSVSSVFLHGIHIDLSDPVYNLAIAFTLVNLPLIALLCVKRRWNALETCLLVPLLVSVVCIVRPLWLANVFAHLPLLHSLRWPFREIAVLNFFTHALFLLAFRPPEGNAARRLIYGAGAVGTTIYLLVFLCIAPTLWLFGPDRQLIMSGEANRYWNTLKANGGPGVGNTRFVVGAPWEALLPQRECVPFSLIGGFNYAALFRVNNVSGFSVTPPPSTQWLKRDTGSEPYFWGGVFSPNAIARICKVYPDIQTIVLHSAVPVPTWTIADGPALRDYMYDPRAGRVYSLPSDTALPNP